MYAPLVVQSSTQNAVKAGMGMYLNSNWVTPQIYTSPFGGAQITVPAGWGMGGLKKGLGCSCGCGGGSGCSEFEGMGDWTDPSTWGLTEWGTVLGGGAVLMYLFNKGKRHVRRRRAIRRVRGY